MDALAPLLGETVWHTVTHDPSIAEVSERHYAEIVRLLRRQGRGFPRDMQILEAGAYAHTTGYALAHRRGARVTLLDVAASTLKLGRQMAAQQGLPPAGARLVAADLHDLPFEDGQFHLVYVCSTLHHASDWEKALAELMRVVAPGGLLFLENEPCLREFCFYRFRTNRLHAFTPFEQALDSLGVIRTVAEPYLGSRPETLFGMIENQSIGLDAMLTAMGERCELVEMQLSPESCMGPLERDLLARPREGPAISAWLAQRLEACFAQAAAQLGERERGLGFSLPSRAETEALCAKIAPRIALLPAATRARLVQRFESAARRLSAGRWPRRANAYRTELARLFGAGVRLTARKRGVPVVSVEGRLNAVYPESEGVVLGFKPAVLRLLADRHLLLPDLQKAPDAEIERAFPAPEWQLESSSSGVRSAVTRAPRARVACPLPAQGARLFFRLHASRINLPYRVALQLGARELAAAEVFQTESFLLAAQVPPAERAAERSLELHVTAAMPDTGDALQSRVSIAYAGSAAL